MTVEAGRAPRRSPRRNRPLVLVNGSPLWPPVTGVQRVARSLTRQLLAESAPGTVRVVGGPPGFGGGPGVLGGSRPGRALWEQTALPVRARRARAVLNLGNLAPVAGRNNLVLTYDLHALRHRAHYRPGLGAAYWRLAELAYRRARFRVTLSRTIADDLEATLGGRVDAVVPPGIDAAFRPAPGPAVAAVCDRLGVERPYLVVVGWSQPAKRAPLALAAHRALVADRPHHLVLAGAPRGDFAPVDLGEVPPTVVVTGRLSDGDLAALYTGSAGLLFCTEYEGFGLPAVEALGCGAPVAASAIPVLEEVLDGLPGVSFVPAATPEAWAAAAEALLGSAGEPSGPPAHRRSLAALARYPWVGKGRALLEVVGA